MWGSADPDFRAQAENYLFEERVSSPRQQDYEGSANPGTSTFEAWDRWHRDEYLWKSVHREVPETFTSINRDAAHSGALAPDQYLVRVEGLEYALGDTGFSLDELHSALGVARGEGTHSGYTSADAEDAMAQICDSLNRNPYGIRPRFAGFLQDVEEALTEHDWPDHVRDRFGLGHYTPWTLGETIPIVLLRYTVREVLNAAMGKSGVRHPVCVPTVLDSQFSRYYYPAPRELPYGRTLNLAAAEISEDKIAEIMHFRIRYRSEHIYRVGAVTKGLDTLDAVGLSTMRSNHLFCLQYDSGREDFGAPPAHWTAL